MPVLFRWRGYRFFFYSADCSEPHHVHVRYGREECKIWLHDLGVEYCRGIPARDLGQIVAVVRDRRQSFQEAWNAHCADRD